MMKASTASLINSITLIACSVWAYVAIGGASLTALIPAGFGLALIAMNRGVAAENKVIAHIAVLLTLVVLIALIAPLSSAIGGGDTGSLVRIALMIVTTIYAMIAFIKSFRDARRARE